MDITSLSSSSVDFRASRKYFGLDINSFWIQREETISDFIFGFKPALSFREAEQVGFSFHTHYRAAGAAEFFALGRRSFNLWTYRESNLTGSVSSLDSVFALCAPQNAQRGFASRTKAPRAFLVWTYRESNPDLFHAMEPFYRYTIGPQREDYSIF